MVAEDEMPQHGSSRSSIKKHIPQLRHSANPDSKGLNLNPNP